MKTFKIIASAVVCLVFVFGIYITGKQSNLEPQVIGSVTQGGEYHSTSTTPSSFKVLDTGPGILGSVTITTAGNDTVALYDATTSNASLRTLSATTTLAFFQTTATVGTYVFDATFYTGLLVQVSGGNVASTTITFRP